MEWDQLILAVLLGAVSGAVYTLIYWWLIFGRKVKKALKEIKDVRDIEES